MTPSPRSREPWEKGIVERVARVIAQADDGGSDFDWESFVPHARAAIEAMRDPTESMVEAHYRTHARAETVFADAPEVWRAMIDAALAPPQNTPSDGGSRAVHEGKPEVDGEAAGG